MSTRRHVPQAALADAEPPPFEPVLSRRRQPSGVLRRFGVLDPSEAVALVARERRESLLAMHSHRLGREELEDCYSQATLELLARARRPHQSAKTIGSQSGGPFAGSEHIANALDQRLRSRIQDRQRALGGRSPIEAAMAAAVPLLAPCEDRAGVCGLLVDERADVVRIALLREELGRIARFSRELTRDQRLLLTSQVGGDQTPAAFCAQHGWSLEKYRKVGQRARACLSALLAADSVDHIRPTVYARPAAVPLTAGGRINTQGPVYENHSPT